MNHRHRPARRAPPPVGPAAVIGKAPATADQTLPIVEHPDGYYWQADGGRQAFGPFETYEDARVDRDRADEQRPVEGETLRQAESEIGIADWIDPETGEPAEGESPPYLSEP